MAIKPDFLRRLLIVWTLALALFQFSENTADPDLWAHTMFGEQLLRSGKPQTTEIFSWTARGQPFINHEYLAEAVIGGAHQIAGGPGLLALKILVGFLVLALAIRLGGQFLTPDSKPIVWIVAAIAVVEISFGFAARPQIFTVLGLATEFWCLRKIYEGKIWWAAALPFLFLAWINMHGGFMAGLVLLFAAAGANTLQRKPSLALWGVGVICSGLVFVNPWGLELPRSIIEAVLYNRSDIQEWRHTPLGWDHACFFILVALTAVSFWLSRRPRVLWEMAMCAILTVLALRAVRHTPLFSVAALAFAPPHLADVLERYRTSFARVLELLQSQWAAFLLMASSIGMLAATLALHKEHPLTMEVPRNQYPLWAIHFIKENNLRGNALMFFDWGELCLWELPDVAPSVDGRMDTCYSYPLLQEHWKFYRGEPVNTNILDIDHADLALLPVNLAAGPALKARGWTPVYVDALAVVLVRDTNRFPNLPRDLPFQDPAATFVRAPFPNAPSLRVSQTARMINENPRDAKRL
jgi:hypothetical protein